MLKLTIGYYLVWFLVTYFISKSKKEIGKERKDRFFGTFIFHTIFYAILYFIGFFDYLLSE